MYHPCENLSPRNEDAPAAAWLMTPDDQRRFAIEVVRRLQAAGFMAYWAGGCVRDQLLGRTPKDYDVATNAMPEQVRELFGRRRTLAIGAAFGVYSVIGPKAAGTVEVTTFRRDAAYSDGRHPDSVTFSTAEEDASRRDFTINGLFYDPTERRVIDFVGGQEDLAVGLIRAIGNARDRFAEDKLRMLRAVRFAAAFDFTLDAGDAGGHRRNGVRNPRRQSRTDRCGNARACWPTPAAPPACGCCWKPGWRRKCCRKSCPATIPSGNGSTTRWNCSRGWARVRLSAGAGRRAVSLRRCGGRGRGLPAVAAFEQGNGSDVLARRESRRAGRRPSDAMVGDSAAVGGRGHRRSVGLDGGRLGRQAPRRPIAGSGWPNPARRSIPRRW